MTPLEPPFLDEERGRRLLSLARAAIEAALAGRHQTLPGAIAETSPPGGGAFVSLYSGGRLRGCIGNLGAGEALEDLVSRCAVAAAFEDPRFPALRPEEMADLAIEVSVLGPPELLADPALIEVGRHGLIVAREGRRGLLLPQVAAERGWDRERFLRETCRKAGLEPEAWRAGARVEYFTARVLAEPRPGRG